jgi:cytoskeletal protein RodZ
MTPLDSGSGAEAYRSPAWAEREPAVSLNDAPTLADALRSARERSGRSHQDLAEATRVRRDYLIALEQGAWDRLPSRPFAVGYVRAYAQALGLDEETAADRFKAECPDRSAPLAAPVGSELDDVKPRAAPWIVAALVVAVAVVGWNIFEHVANAPKTTSNKLADQAETANTGGFFGGKTNIPLSAPLPAEAGQGLPPPYIPPGLEHELGDAQSDQAQLQRASLTGPAIPAGAAFNPKGPIYGVEANASQVTLQARKAASIVLRSPDGVNVVFAKQLAPGEAWRAPLNASNLVVDVSDPNAFDMYLNGEYHGVLTAQATALSQLNAQAAQLAAQAAAQAQRAAQVNRTQADEAGPVPAAAEPQTPGA